MERIKYYFEKYKIYIGILFSIIFLVLIFLLIPKQEKNNIKNESLVMVENNLLDSKDKEEEIKTDKIKVDVKGAVVNPGVYELDNDSRVQDAINEAGGLTNNSNIEYINLSKKLKDEMVIIVYTNEYIEKIKNDEEKIIYIKYECECPDEINDVCIEQKDVLNNIENKDIDIKSDDDKLISINTASLEELMTLSGIGEGKAKAIIEYRSKNGEFKTLEDIMNVSGIGEAAYSKIKDNIKL